MSVWPSFADVPPTLATSEGSLISVSVHVEPQYLESLLDALAQLDFPINPQIYHGASVTCVYADGSEESQPATMVEFPAYESRLPAIRDMLAAYGFPADAVHVAAMLEEIHSGLIVEPAPPGAPYVKKIYRKRAGAAAAH